MSLDSQHYESASAASALDRLVMLVASELAAGNDVDLSAVTAGCPELREQLEMLLPTLQSITDLGLAVDATELNSIGADAPHLGSTGGVLGDFRILREIGRGGMGIVYEAEQMALSRRVALKVLPLASLLDDRQLRRFKNEARAAALLSHPNIVSIHAVGCDRSVHFYVMELIDGYNLAEVIHQLHDAPLADKVDGDCVDGDCDFEPIAELVIQRTSRPDEYYRAVAEIGAQVAEALQFAHEEGIIHRDIKPANLLLDGTSQIHVADFGLADVRGFEDLTLSGDLIGTVRYMSPEYISSGSVVDARGDVYSLGLTLFEFACGRPAFDAESRASLIRQITETNPTRLKSLAADVPDDLETIISTAIAKDPAERYRTAAEFAEDLRRFQQNRTILAKRPTVFRRVSRFVNRNPVPVTLAAIICSLLVLLTVVSSIAAVGFRREAEAERERLREAHELALQQELALYAQDMLLTKTHIDEGRILEAEETLLKWVPSDKPTDHRSFEWCYLWAASHDNAPIHSYRFHLPAYSVAHLKSRNELAIGGFSNEVYSYSLTPDQRNQRRLKLAGRALPNEVYCIAECGDHVITGGRGGRLAYWNLQSGQLISDHYLGSAGVIQSLAVSQDSSLVAAGARLSNGGAVFVWDLRTNSLQKLDIDLAGCALVAFGPNRTLICTSAEHSFVHFFSFDVSSGTWAENVNSTINVAANEYECEIMAMDVFGDLLALATNCDSYSDRRSNLEIWNLSQRTRLANVQVVDSFRSLAFSPDGSHIAVGSHRGNGYLVALPTSSKNGIYDTSLRHRRLHQEAVIGLCFLSNEQIATAGGDGFVHIWETGSWKHSGEHCKGLDRATTDGAFAAFISESRVATASRQDVTVWDATTGSKVSTVVDHLGDYSLALIDANPKTQQLAVLLTHWPPENKPGLAIVWDAITGQEHCRFNLPINTVCKTPALSNDGNYLALAANGCAIVFDLRRKRQIRDLTFPENAACVCFSPDSSELAVGSWDGLTRVFNMPDFTEKWTLESDTLAPVRLAYSPEGNELATYGFGNRTVRLFDRNNGRFRREFVPTNQYCTSLQFSPDGTRILTAGADGMLRLWMRDSLEEVMRFQAGGFTRCDFSPNGHSLVIVGRESVWVLGSEDAANIMQLSVVDLEAIPCTTNAK